MIPFNKPFCTGNELELISQVIQKGKYSGNGYFTQLCHQYFQKKYGFKKCLLTTSCTDALEMCAILTGVGYGDEVIIPSYTFVSTALAFVRQGATVVFADSLKQNPNIDPDSIENAITAKTKAIVVVHYAGCACEMERIIEIAKKYNLMLIEDAAQAIDSYYISPKTNERKALGSIGDVAAFSFHETKNIQCGEGGLLVINNEDLIGRSETIWEKGTNRAEFFRGEVNKYEWVDLGSSFLPSEYTAAFLYAQLQEMESIQNRRIDIWNMYHEGLQNIKQVTISEIPEYATKNAHVFYLICKSEKERSDLILWMKQHEIQLVFHYLSLHKSKFYKNHNIELSSKPLPYSDFYTDNLVRLPLYNNMSDDDVKAVIDLIKDFFAQ
jgi:dTDP-4-amino-4,6-dideoxygalactose transaminase